MQLEQFSALVSALDNVQSGYVKDCSKWEQYGLGLVHGLLLCGAVSPALAGLYETALTAAWKSSRNKNSHDSADYFADYQAKRSAFIKGASHG